MGLKNHIIFFGYSSSSNDVAKEIIDFNEEIDEERKVVIVSASEDVLEIPGILHVKMDYFDSAVLKEKSLCVQDAYACIVFSENLFNDLSSAIDIKTILTVYNIKKQFPDTYVLAEIIDRGNTGIINNTGCDAVIYKEEIDAELIINCIKYPMISKMIYELLSYEGKKLLETTLDEIGFTSETTIKQIKIYGLEKDITFIGYINKEKESILAPSNETIISNDDILIYLG
jgi:hypothetical protein